jgi:hypothetical protein
MGCNTNMQTESSLSTLISHSFWLMTTDLVLYGERFCQKEGPWVMSLSYSTRDLQRVQTISLISFGVGLLTCLAFHLIFRHVGLEFLKCIHWWWPYKNGSTLFKSTLKMLCIITKLYILYLQITPQKMHFLTVLLLHSTATTCFDARASSSGSFSVPAELL